MDLSIRDVQTDCWADCLVRDLAIIHAQPPSHLHPVWARIAFPLSVFSRTGRHGTTHGVLVQAHDWSTEKTGFLFMYLVSIFPALAFLYVAFGDVVIEPGLLPGHAPVVVACHADEVWRHGGRRLRRFLGLLLLMGLAGVVGPMLN